MSDNNTQRFESRTFSGTVVSDSMDKTIMVRVDRTKLNSKYKMRFAVSDKYPVHDPENRFKVGDVVTFVECRPLSKSKRWRVVSAPAEVTEE